MPAAIVFDMDGTLIDSVDQHARAWQDAFAHIGVSTKFEEVRRQIGKGADQLLPVFLPEAEVKRVGEELSAWRNRRFQEHYFAELKPFPGVRALFERLLADGKRIALASSAKANELERYKKLAQIDDLVDTQTSSDDAEKSKPHPDIFQAALTRLAMPAHQAISVGDTPYDAIASNKAGLRCIGVRCGGFPEQDLRDGGCEQIFDGPADLLAQYERWAEGKK